MTYIWQCVNCHWHATFLNNVVNNRDYNTPIYIYGLILQCIDMWRYIQPTCLCNAVSRKNTRSSVMRHFANNDSRQEHRQEHRFSISVHALYCFLMYFVTRLAFTELQWRHLVQHMQDGKITWTNNWRSVSRTWRFSEEFLQWPIESWHSERITGYVYRVTVREQELLVLIHEYICDSISDLHTYSINDINELNLL